MEENTEENLIVPTHEQVTAEDLHEIIQSKDIKKLREYVQDHDAVDIATAMDDMSDVDIFVFNLKLSAVNIPLKSFHIWIAMISKKLLKVCLRARCKTSSKNYLPMT